MTYLVDHIGHLTLHLVRVNVLLAAETDGSSKFGDGDSRSPYRWRGRCLGIGSLKPAGEEDLAQQVAETGIVRTLEREVDTPLDKLVFAFLQGLVESVQVTLLDALGEGQEERLQAWVGLQKGRCREGVGSEKMTWYEVGEDKPKLSQYLDSESWRCTRPKGDILLVSHRILVAEAQSLGQTLLSLHIVLLEKEENTLVILEGDLLGFWKLVQ